MEYSTVAFYIITSSDRKTLGNDDEDDREQKDFLKLNCKKYD